MVRQHPAFTTFVVSAGRRRDATALLVDARSRPLPPFSGGGMSAQRTAPLGHARLPSVLIGCLSQPVTVGGLSSVAVVSTVAVLPTD